MSALRAFAALVTLGAFGFCLGSSSAAEPLEINAILSTTGSGAFLGSQEAEALTILQGLVNKSGGIRGRELRFVIADDRTDPQTSVQLTNALIAKNVSVFLGSSLAATCGAMQPLISKSGPVMYCLSSVLEPPAGSYLFSAGVSNRYIFENMNAFLEAHHWTKIALLTSTDATGQTSEHLLETLLNEPQWRALSFVAREHFALTDLSTTAQVEKLKAAHPNAYVVFSSGTGFNTVLRGLRDAGVTEPLFTAGGNMVPEQLRQLAAMMPPGGLYFTTSSGVVPDRTLSKDRRAAQATFASALRDAHVTPSFPHVLAWDPALIVVTALRTLGPDATADQIRDYIAKLHNWSGNTGTYDFLAVPQRGLNQQATSIYRWLPDRNEFTVVSAR